MQLQHGVLRTNCIDCLDRTNVAQFAYGLTALGQQLHALGLTDTPSIEAQSSAARELMDMYEDMGNVLSRQVGSYFMLLCCAVLCCAVLCCAVLCCYLVCITTLCCFDALLLMLCWLAADACSCSFSLCQSVQYL